MITALIVWVLLSCAVGTIQRGQTQPVGKGTVFFLIDLQNLDSTKVNIGEKGRLFAMAKAQVKLKEGKHLYAVFLDSGVYELNSFIDKNISIGFNEYLSFQPRNPEYTGHDNRGYCDSFIATPKTNSYAGSMKFVVENDGFFLYCDRSDSAKKNAVELFGKEFPKLNETYQLN